MRFLTVLSVFLQLTYTINLVVIALVLLYFECGESPAVTEMQGLFLRFIPGLLVTLSITIIGCVLQLSLRGIRRVVVGIFGIQVLFVIVFETASMVIWYNLRGHLETFSTVGVMLLGLENYQRHQFARFFIDYIQTYFKCCGVTESLIEWQQVAMEHGYIGLGDYKAWVPLSCCRKGTVCDHSFETDFVHQEHLESALSSGEVTYDELLVPFHALINKVPCPTILKAASGEAQTYLLTCVTCFLLLKSGITILAVLDAIDEHIKKSSEIHE